MLRKVLFIIVSATISFFYFGGCDNSSNNADSEQEALKTVAEYEAEAEAQITEDNLAEELENLEKAIEKEISEEP